MSQVEAANQIPTSGASMAAYEQGARDVPDAILERMGELYGVHVAVLRYGESVVREAGLSEVRRLVLKAAQDLSAVAALIAGPLPKTTAPQDDQDVQEAFAASAESEREVQARRQEEAGRLPPGRVAPKAATGRRR